MTPTRPAVLVALVLGALAVAAGVLLLARPSLPAVPWTLPVALGTVAAGLLAASLSFRRRLRGAPGARPYDPLQAARMVVLAKACSHAGAVLAGAYGGVALALVLTSSSPARRADAGLSALAALAALGVLAVGLLLERFCRVPPSGPGEPGAPGGPGGGGPGAPDVPAPRGPAAR
ncbi:DUF3180 domain-containing protein [Vallicoccus soli]|uniref:DUF3180 domain-containing protein n=1 Tax=Vallicoccus soli TaxID=2339232 RepID=A0A3A3ZJV5_9ACTN|nr:DUF3180 domain-containing protein [Vallicoccus soli]RJK96033.1 DUF3180 domain-containing protein [Vallicoccus soli]